jgi:hypothetical protein
MLNRRALSKEWVPAPLKKMKLARTTADAPPLCITNVQNRTLAELFTSEHNFPISTDPLVVAAIMIT